MTRRTRYSNKRSHRKKQRGGDLDEHAKQTVAQSLTSREANRAKWLQAACRNPDNCLALGIYGESIRQYFEGFTNFAYLDKSNVKRIGAPSNNGFIIELPFTKNGYTAYTVLKSAAQATSDNLLYEYIVGKRFINKLLQTLPVFLETYDLYEYVDDSAFDVVRDAASLKTLGAMDISTNIRRMNTHVTSTNSANSSQMLFALNQSCRKNKKICLTIQHFDNFVPVNSMLSKEKYPSFKGDLVAVIFQVYFALDQLKTNYTHYDLHTNNVMLYKPFEGNQCIHMRYHLGNQVVEFKSEYIPKIIDYGRNYFNDGKVNTGELLEEMCSLPDCTPKCGENVGYASIRGSAWNGNMPDVSDFYWINPAKRNMSHDLRFMKYILDKIPINVNLVYQHMFGTPEVVQSEPGKIQNVKDMVDVARDCLIDPQDSNVLNNRAKYDGWAVAATLDVYDDGRPFQFEYVAPPPPAKPVPIPNAPPVHKLSFGPSPTPSPSQPVASSLSTIPV